MALTKPKGKNKYCAPSAMSAIFNITTDYASKLLRQVTEERAIRGVYNRDLIQCLINNGVKFTHKRYDKGMTFNQLVRQGIITKPSIINLTEHYIAFDGNNWCDSGYWGKKRKIYTIEQIPKPRTRVKSIIEIHEHHIKEPAKKPAKKSLNFDDLITNYATPELHSEISMIKEFIIERLEYEPDVNEKILQERYVNIHGEHIKGETIKDRFMYLILEEVKDDWRFNLNDESLQSIMTITMLNGKHKFIQIRR